MHNAFVELCCVLALSHLCLFFTSVMSSVPAHSYKKWQKCGDGIELHCDLVLSHLRLFFASIITPVSTHSRNGKDGHQERLLMVQIHDEYTMSVAHGANI
jgi:hypothetical protein